MTKFLVLCIITALLFSTGCATILKSSHEMVTITTDTPATDVYVDGMYLGKAPVKVYLKPKKNHVISFQKESHRTRHYVLGHKTSVGWVLVSLLGSFYGIGLIIDAVADSWNTFTTNHVHVRMRSSCPTACACSSTSPCGGD